MSIHASLFLMLLAAVLIGCETPRAGQADDATPREASWPVRPPPRASAALAFTPPVAYAADDMFYLDRAGRGPGAYAGYEQTVVSETWVRTDDRQRWGRWGDQSTFERRAVSTTVTVQKR